MDRNYFKEKRTGKKSKGSYTKCCGEVQDRHILNKKKPDEWELIEQYCENHLSSYPSTKDITPICCKKCGRLIKYISTIDPKLYNWRNKIDE